MGCAAVLYLSDKRNGPYPQEWPPAEKIAIPGDPPGAVHGRAQQHYIHAALPEGEPARAAEPAEKAPSVEVIMSKIFLIRGKKVMIDRDLARKS